MLLFDLREPINALSHGAGMLLALPVTWVLWQRSRLHGARDQEPACRRRLRYHRGKALCLLIFGISLISCYGISAAFHGVRLEGERLHRLQRLDHVGIYLLIAGDVHAGRLGADARFVVMGDAHDGLDDRHALCIACLVRRCDADLGIDCGLPGDGLGSSVLLLQAGRGSFPPDAAAPPSRGGVLQRRRSPEPLTVACAASGRVCRSRIVAFLCHRRQCLPYLFHDESRCAIPSARRGGCGRQSIASRARITRAIIVGTRYAAGFLTFPYPKEPSMHGCRSMPGPALATTSRHFSRQCDAQPLDRGNGSSSRRVRFASSCRLLHSR